MNFKSKTAVLLALAVLVSVMAGGVLAAAPTMDTSTSVTSQQTDITDGGTQTYNGSTASNFSWSADSNNTKVVIKQGNHTLYTATPDNYHYNSSSGMSYFNVSLADDGSSYAGLDLGAGKNATLKATITNNTSAANPNTTNVSWTFANGDSKAFVRLDDGAAGSSHSTIAQMKWYSKYAGGSTPPVKYSRDIAVAGKNTTTVQMAVSNTSYTDAFSKSTKGHAAGDWLPAAYAQVNGNYVPIFDSKATSASWLGSDATYATVSSDGSTITFHNLGDQLSKSDTTATVNVVGSEQMGLMNAYPMFRNYGVGYTKAASMAVHAINIDGNPFQ